MQKPSQQCTRMKILNKVSLMTSVMQIQKDNVTVA